MNIKDYEEQIKRSQEEIEHLNQELINLENARADISEEAYRREYNNINNYLKNEAERLETNRTIVNEYNSMRRNIELYRQAREELNLHPDNIEASEDIERLEEEINRSKTILPEELQEAIRNEINNSLKENPNSTNDDDSEMIKINSSDNQKNHKIQEENKKLEDYLYDNNGNIIYIPGTNIPKPRNRNIHESDKDYIEFLKQYYENNFQKNSQNISTANDSDNLSNPPQIEQKPDPLGLPGPIEKPSPPQIEQKPDPLGLPGPIKKPLPPQDERKQKKGLIQIINELTEGLEIKKKSGKKYVASNIKVATNFKNELQSGNYLYNIVHLASGTIKSIATVINKIYSKITLSKNQKENMKILTERINNLDEEDLMTIYNEYRGSRVIQERFPSAINVLLQQKIGEFTLSKVTELNNENIVGYQEMFSSYQQLKAINEALNNPNIKSENRKALMNQKQKILEGKIELIQKIRNNYIVANQWISGGEHGFSEDMKAATTKLSITGKRFAKDHDLDNELLEQEAKLEQQENEAIIKKDAEKALNAFINMEQLLSKETKIKNSVFGKRSTGQKYYSPIAAQLDYRDDPFIKDIFTTIALTGAALSTINALKTHGPDSEKIITQQQQEANRVNRANDATMQQVHQTGQNIAEKRGDFIEGMKATQKQDINNIGMTLERKGLDEHGWITGTDPYHQTDAMNHAQTVDIYHSVETQIEKIANQYAKGAITQVQAMEAISKVSNQTQSTFNTIINSYMPELQNYARANPQFDLTGVMGAFQYIQQHPNAITNMNQAAIEITNIGDTLAGLNATHVQALQSLPNDLQTTLFGAASALALASQVATTTDTNRKKGKYGNEITKLVEESMQQDNPEISAGVNKR